MQFLLRSLFIWPKLAVLIAGTSIFLSLSCVGCTKKQEPIKLGLANTLSGPASTSGIHSRNAVMLAVDQINTAGGIHGRPVKLVIQDDKGRADDGVSAVTSLIDEGVVAIIGPYLSTVSVKAVPIVNENQIVMISPGATTVQLTPK